MSLHIAQKFHRRESRKTFSILSAKFLRQWKRVERSLAASLHHMRLWMVVLIAASVVTLLALSLFSPLFTVQSISVRRQDARIDVAEIQKLLFPFFGRHLFFLSPRLLADTVQDAYPEVASVKTEKRFPHDVRLTLSMDPVVADVFVKAPDATEHTKTASGASVQHSLTSRGIYLEYASPEAETKRMRLSIVDWVVKPSHRQQLLSEELLHAMQNAENILTESFGHRVSDITLYVRAQEFHVRTERIMLWFDLATPLVQQVAHYREFLRSLPADAATQYIDLRLHDRVVYR